MSPRPSLITFTTDFGLSDWFVGTMKGVVLGMAPQTQIIDISHAVPSGNRRAGAFALRSAFGYFPKGTVHVAVVDPGVGSNRRAIAVETRNYLFLGPDNGVLSWALIDEDVLAIHSLDHSKYFLPRVGRTFHGRDVFAPVAAHLAKGLPIAKLGWKQASFVRLPWPEPRVQRSKIRGEVLHLDKFGNAISNIDASAVSALSVNAGIEVRLGRKRIGGLSPCFASVPQGQPVAVIGSSGFLEIAVNGGNAARLLKISIGNPVHVSPIPER